MCCGSVLLFILLFLFLFCFWSVERQAMCREYVLYAFMSLWLETGRYVFHTVLWLCTLKHSHAPSNTRGHKHPYKPVTYISMPSLKVKMVVVLEVAEPCFRSPMLSYIFSPGSSRALAGRCCSLGVCCGGGGGGGGCCKGCWGFFFFGRSVALALGRGGGRSRFQALAPAPAPPPSMAS